MNKQEEKLVKTEPEVVVRPRFVETEKMLDKIAAITKEIAAKAYDFFVERGSQFGSHFEDWLRAESEMLRTAPVEIKETTDLVNVRLAVPGFKPNEIEISVKGNNLIINGETSEEEKRDDPTTFYSEWRSNRFMRQLTLPSEVETNNVEATLKDGVLNLSLQKKAEEEAVKVAVKAA